MRNERKHDEYDLTMFDGFHVGRREVYTMVEIPHTHTGYGSGPIESGNDRAIKEGVVDTESMRLVRHGMALGGSWVAIVDEYTEEQFEELEELVASLVDYPILSDDHYHQADEEMKLDFIRMELSYEDADLEADVLNAIHELGLLLEHEGDGHYYISEDDFGAALQYAKQQEVAAV